MSAAEIPERLLPLLMHPDPIVGLGDVIVELQAPWRREAACRDHPEVNFFPERGESAAPAKAICARCPSRLPCLEYGLAHSDEVGIWGGLSGRERRRVHRERGGKPRQTRLTRDFLNSLVAQYRALVLVTPSPTQAIAHNRVETIDTVKYWLRRARALGLLGSLAEERARARQHSIPSADAVAVHIGDTAASSSRRPAS